MVEDEIVEVLWVARYDYNADWKLNNHKHDYYQIIYFIEGSGEIYLNGSKYFIGDELLLLVTPEEQHGLIASKSTVVKTLDLKFLVKDEHLKKEISLLSGISQTENSEIKTLLLKIKEEGTEKRDYYKAMSNMYLHQILLILLRCKNPTKGIKSPNIENEISSDNYYITLW